MEPDKSDAARSGQLKADQLGTADVTTSTIANIGPGIDFYFGFGVIVVTAGVGAPLTILAAAIAIGFLAWTVSEFTRKEPSAGSFITYVESAFGRDAGIATALLVLIGYTAAMAGVIAIAGGFLTMTVNHFGHVSIPWIFATLVIALGGLWLMVTGIRLSTTVVMVAVVLQVLVMVGICCWILIEQRGHLSTAPFRWSSVKDGLLGLSGGFPLALYLFIGWENGPSLAEETRDPSRAIPRALLYSISLATFLFVLFAYATIVGYHYDLRSIGRSSIPFLSVADTVLGSFSIVAWIVGIVAVLATFIAGVTSQSRMIFDGGREGFLPRRLSHVHPRYGTPTAALVTIVLSGLGIIAIWGGVHLATSSTGMMNPVGLYAECSTFGTIIILLVYAATTVALPVLMWRNYRSSFSLFRHGVIPLLGLVALLVPFAALFHPGQPSPYNLYPFFAVAVVVLVVGVALLRARGMNRSLRSQNTGKIEA